MNFEDALKEKLNEIQQAFADFETLKKMWLQSQGKDVNEFQNYLEDGPHVLQGKLPEEEFELEDFWGLENKSDEHLEEEAELPWNSYSAIGENFADHAEVAPPSLITDYSKIDAEHPVFWFGAPIGIPTYNSLHSPYSGTLMLLPNRPTHPREEDIK